MVNQAIKNIFNRMVTEKGQTVSELSDHQPVMVIFLRHFGCTFCREALAELSEKKAAIEAKGTKLVFVHMSDYETANRYFSRYNLEGIDNVSDPDCEFYASFGLVKGNFRQLFGLTSWIRGFQAGIVEGHGIGQQIGDGFQMPGVFVIQGRRIQEHYIHKLSSDKPNYEKLAECCVL
ncbi:MAG: peroxiredoxin-like family protein [Bacteroidota bacterium]